jgi:hypothetical protein
VGCFLAFETSEVRGREIRFGEIVAGVDVVALAERHERAAGQDGLGEEVGGGDRVDAVVARVDVEDAPAESVSALDLTKGKEAVHRRFIAAAVAAACDAVLLW